MHAPKFINNSEVFRIEQLLRIRYLKARHKYFMATMHPLPAKADRKRIDICKPFIEYDISGYGFGTPGTITIYIGFGLGTCKHRYECMGVKIIYDPKDPK